MSTAIAHRMCSRTGSTSKTREHCRSTKVVSSMSVGKGTRPESHFRGSFARASQSTCHTQCRRCRGCRAGPRHIPRGRCVKRPTRRTEGGGSPATEWHRNENSQQRGMQPSSQLTGTGEGRGGTGEGRNPSPTTPLLADHLSPLLPPSPKRRG